MKYFNALFNILWSASKELAKEKENLGRKIKDWESQSMLHDQEKDFKYHARNVGFM